MILRLPVAFFTTPFSGGWEQGRGEGATGQQVCQGHEAGAGASRPRLQATCVSSQRQAVSGARACAPAPQRGHWRTRLQRSRARLNTASRCTRSILGLRSALHAGRWAGGGWAGGERETGGWVRVGCIPGPPSLGQARAASAAQAGGDATARHASRHASCHAGSHACSAPRHAPQRAAPLLVGQQHTGAALADGLQDLHRGLEVADVEDRQLQADVAKVARAVGQRLAKGGEQAGWV